MKRSTAATERELGVSQLPIIALRYWHVLARSRLALGLGVALEDAGRVPDQLLRLTTPHTHLSNAGTPSRLRLHRALVNLTRVATLRGYFLLGWDFSAADTNASVEGCKGYRGL